MADGKRTAEVGTIATPSPLHTCECGAVATVWHAEGGILVSIHCDKHAPSLRKRGAP